VQIRVFETAEQASHALAARIADAIDERPDLVLGLPTGRTPISTYTALGQMYADGGVDFSRIRTFNLDEFVGLGPSDAGSFRQFMERHLFSIVNVDPAQIEFLNGMASDLDAECDRYESSIAYAGGLGFLLLGIGSNGHIGFNEPADQLQARTHRVTLLESTRRSNAALFGGDLERVPREALSMGMGAIVKAATIVLFATGTGKARCIERMVHGPVTTHLPASFLQLHRRVELYLDTAAAALLPSS
jgi:glucosamine-6-phosphate deaminase